MSKIKNPNTSNNIEQPALYEAFQELSAKLHFEFPDRHSGKCFMINCPSDFMYTVNFTMSYAKFLAMKQNYRVLIIDASFKSTSISSCLEVHNNYGLLDLMQGKSFGDVIITLYNANSNIDFIAPGKSSLDEVSLLFSDNLENALMSFRQYYNVVLINCGSILVDAAVRAFPQLVDCAFLLGVEGLTSQSEIELTRQTLHQSKVIRTKLLYIPR